MKPVSLKVCAKTSDMFHGDLMVDGELKRSHSGYVPSFLSKKDSSDYLEFEIDLRTGQILNWVPPTDEQLNDLYEEFGRRQGDKFKVGDLFTFCNAEWVILEVHGGGEYGAKLTNGTGVPVFFDDEELMFPKVM